MLDEGDLTLMAAELTQVGGVRAVALGGSRARGTHTTSSDYDIGVYYDHDLDLEALRQLANQRSDGDVELAGPGRWGPWVDGGAWLSVLGSPVDWILRNTERVEDQCERALRGEFTFHDQPGHPLGFLDISYAGEVAVCRPLADPEGCITALKGTLEPYPDALRRAFVARLWRAGFLLDGATKGASRGDVAYVALSCASAAMICAHAWHAAAGVWVLNEKDLVPAVARLPLDTGPFVDHVHEALSSLGPTEQSLSTTISITRKAVRYTERQLT